MAGCPVDHGSSSSSSASTSQAEKCPVDHSKLQKQAGDTDKCPVDHKARSTWSTIFSWSPSASPLSASSSPSAHPPPDSSSAPLPTHPALPQTRETSSIPRADGTNWVYPSEAQFFSALLRKQHNPHKSDMRVVVPIHNAVNEKCWRDILEWERGWGGERCGGVRLVSFKGRPGEMTVRARWRRLLGYQAPFDRHDWIVDRCGTQMRYIIDFYTGKPAPGSPNSLAFFIDARPAFDNWDAVKMRASRFCERWFGISFVAAGRDQGVSAPNAQMQTQTQSGQAETAKGS